MGCFDVPFASEARSWYFCSVEMGIVHSNTSSLLCFYSYINCVFQHSFARLQLPSRLCQAFLRGNNAISVSQRQERYLNCFRPNIASKYVTFAIWKAEVAGITLSTLFLAIILFPPIQDYLLHAAWRGRLAITVSVKLMPSHGTMPYQQTFMSLQQVWLKACRYTNKNYSIKRLP